jgi:putative transposase
MTTQSAILALLDTGKPLEIKRAMAVRMSVCGYSRAEIAEVLNVSVQFVDKWKAIYFQQGVDGLKLGYRGSQGYLSPEERQQIIAYIKAQDSFTVSELREHIKTHYAVEYNSLKSYSDLLHAGGFGYRKNAKK